VQNADRRAASRLEFVGDQWGSLHGQETLRLRNFGRDGVLIESATELPVGSVHAIKLVHLANAAQCLVTVKHLAARSDAKVLQRYLIGLQFINLDSQALALIDQMLADQPAPPLSDEA
jgi:hypothetical protein